MEALRRDARFFSRLGAVFVAATVIGFSTTFLIPATVGRFTGEPVLVLHGLLFLSWPILFVVQTLTIGRSPALHRGLGLASISLATAMVIAGFGAIGSSVASWEAEGFARPAQAVSVIVFGGLILFAVFFALAVAKRRDRILHSRLMLLATLAIMQGAWGRIMFTLATHGNAQLLRPGMLPPAPVPLRLTVVHAVIDLAVLVILAWHDRRVFGQVQKVTWIGGAALLAMLFGRHLLAGSTLWIWLVGKLAG